MKRPQASICLAVAIALAAAITAFLVLGGSSTEAAQGGEGDPFEGTWLLNPARSWQFRGEQNKYEVIRISARRRADVPRAEHGARSNVDSHSGYSSKYNDNEWVHYQNFIPGNFRTRSW